MNTAVAGKPKPEPIVCTASAMERPLYFPAEDRQLFGWLHPPRDTARRDLGVVICPPFGFEAMCVHRSERAFAAAIADLGIAVLRFDYGGTGDSEDLPTDADQIEIWRRDIIAATVELQRRTGVTQVCLLGVRLGALLATLAATDATAVRALIAVAPIVSGRRYLREIELTNWHQNSMAPSPARSTGPQPYSEGSVEVSGFVLTPASVTTLARTDLLTQDPRRVTRDVLVVDRSDVPGAQPWSEHLAQLGASTQYLSLPDFAAMMKAPQFSVVPSATIDVVCDWLSRLQEPPRDSAATHVPFTGHQQARAVQDVLPLCADGVAVLERPLWISSDPAVFAIVAEPPTGETSRGGVILLNSGADHHIGPRRMNVSLARRWARQGYFVLRMDLAGLGDSGTRAARPGNEVFPPEAMQDVRDAVQLLRERYGAREVTVCGLCSGAYHALRAAVVGLPVDRILMVNPLNLLPREIHQVDEMELAEIVSSARDYGKRATTLQSWKKLLSGQIDYRRLLRVYAERARLTLGSLLQEIARRLHVPVPLDADLGQQLLRAAARGIRMRFVFSRGDSGIQLLKLQAGSALARIPDHVLCTHIVEGADHDFTAVASRVVLEGILSEELYATRTASPSITAGIPAVSPVKFAGPTMAKR